MILNKRAWSLWLLVGLLFFILLPTNGVTAAESSKQRVFDEADVLTAENIDKLEQTAEKYSVENETDFIILTIADGLNQSQLIRYVEDMYDDNGYGYDKLHGNAAVIVFDPVSRQVYIAGFYKAETYLDDNRVELVLDDIEGDFGKDNFYAAFDGFIKRSSHYMAYKAGINPGSIFLKSGFQLIAALLIAGVIIFTMAYRAGGKVTTNNRTYRDDGATKVNDAYDHYVRTTVTRTKKPSSNRSGGGGGMSGGGHSHSGGGRSV